MTQSIHTATHTDGDPSKHLHTMRLQRFLARSGVASRRGSEKLITEGRVQVNGEVICELGTKVTTELDEVSVDGSPVSFNDAHLYLMLHKPAGYLCTMQDPYCRKTAAELVPIDDNPGLFCVGRLDKDTTGLILFTTDGDFGQHILHPSHTITKTYVAEVESEISDVNLARLEQGVMLDDGMTRPAQAVRLSVYDANAYLTDTDNDHSYVELTIHEGKKHIVKRMFDAVGHPVTRLHRKAIGGVELGGLEPGEYRELTSDDLNRLQWGRRGEDDNCA